MYCRIRNVCTSTHARTHARTRARAHTHTHTHELQLKVMQNITSNNSPKRIPRSIIKPIVEIVKPFFCQKLGCAIVEVWIKFMNNTLKSQNREQTSCKGCKSKKTVKQNKSQLHYQ